MIAALFVEKNGVYYGLDGVDPWDEERDARLYAGPHPVVAHPPCARWGRFWYGGPHPNQRRRRRGDDGGCFESAVRAVQRWGGVLEHPECSSAWTAFNLARPPRCGGWVPAGLYAPGWTCCVEQGHYGHRSRKPTWIYYVGDSKPADFVWGPSVADAELTAKWKARGDRSGIIGVMPKVERKATPTVFRDALLGLVAGVPA